MENIDVNTAGVKDAATAVSNTFSSLKSKITEIATKRNGISDYWSATEADYFVEEMKKIDTLFTSFVTQYNAFMTSIGNITETYDAQEAELTKALEEADNK